MGCDCVNCCAQSATTVAGKTELPSSVRKMWVLFSGVYALALTATAPSVKLIVDTDMSTDCDDVGALCIAHALADAGEVELLATVHNTGADTGVCAVSVINTYYGRANITVGAYKGGFAADERGAYIDDLCGRFPAAAPEQHPLRGT